MVTVWIFFGSDEACGEGAGAGGAAAGACGAGAGAGGAGQGESVADAIFAWVGAAGFVVAGALKAGGAEPGARPWPEPWPVTIGMVATTRGAAFGGSIATGCSSRDTRFSVEPVVAAPACFGSPALFACESAAAGATLIGPLLALMMGGSVGRTEPPNIAR